MLIDCVYFVDGKCSAGHWYNPSETACMTMCQNRVTTSGKSRGLGDTVKKVVEVMVPKKKQCGGCKKRQQRLNELFPYKKEDTNDGN